MTNVLIKMGSLDTEITPNEHEGKDQSNTASSQGKLKIERPKTSVAGVEGRPFKPLNPKLKCIKPVLHDEM